MQKRQGEMSIRLETSAQALAAARASAAAALPAYDEAFVHANATAPASLEEAAALCEWEVPKLSAAGSCGRTMENFSLLPIYGLSALSAEVASSAVMRRLALLHAICAQLAALCGADWLGLYRIIESPAAAAPSAPGERCLVKEAYVGAPSRPFFPLTHAFAATSNNSTVAMTGAAIILPDTRALGGDDPYYVCDARVRSELCAPILDSAGTCIGILDAEAFAPEQFSGEAGAARADALLLACQQLGAARLFVGLLA